jgi:hypothetical protein
MSNIEIVGIFVVGLAAFVGLLLQLITLLNKILEPFKEWLQELSENFKELSGTIHALKIVMERLNANQERTEKLLESHGSRLTHLEKQSHEMLINFAKNNNHRKGTE